MKLLEGVGFVYVKGKRGEILDTSTGQGINHILYRPERRWKVIESGNPYYAASDRNPVWADMELINPVSKVNKIKVEGLQKQEGIFFEGRYIKNSILLISLYGLNGKKVMRFIDNYYQFAGEGKIFFPSSHIHSNKYILTTTERGNITFYKTFVILRE